MNDARDTKKDVASVGEATAELKAMSKADLFRLEQFARLRAVGLPWVDWEDLLHEAIDRVLSGSRRWPHPIPFVVFMCGTIRSISNEWWRSRTRKSELPISTVPSVTTEAQEAIENLEMGDPSPEAEVAARQALKKIEELFQNDDAALRLLRGMALGSTPVEIQRSHGMTETEYATAQRRVRRKISRALEEGKL